MTSLKLTAMVSIASFALCATVLGQKEQESAAVAASAPMPPLGAAMLGMHLEDDMDVTPVKGVPFCAVIITEHTQSFADGNRIHTSENSNICRDSEGRTRHEASLNLLGAGPQGSSPRLITILDPVAAVRYVFDSENKVAHKIPLPPPGRGPDKGLPEGGDVFFMRSFEGGSAQTLSTNAFYRKAGNDSSEAPPVTESLGDQTINGVHAKGTRMTTNIPSGKIGNDKPIIVTSERWYSLDLKATVMTKHDDPWAGGVETQFTNVNTSEPDPSLFKVPSDYKIVDDKDGHVTIRMVGPAPAAK